MYFPKEENGKKELKPTNFQEAADVTSQQMMQM